MASSVASERAFSSAGITISKCHNCLDGDIVEVVQCLKSFISQDLMLRVFPSIADEEVLLDDADQKPANQEGTTTEIANEVEWDFVAVVGDADGDGEDIDEP